MNAHNAAWVVLLVASGCTFKSLDHLQGGEPKDQGSGGTTAGGQSTTIVGASGGLAGSFSTAATLGGQDALGGAGGANTATSGESSSTAGSSAALGGTNAQSTPTGGAPPSSGGATLDSSSLVVSTGGATQVSSPSAGSGGSPIGGSAGTPSATTPPTMVYNVVGQSCGTGLDCQQGISCCAQIEIPSKTFTMGTNTDSSASADEKPAHKATLDTFLMDKFEVSVGRMRRFVQAFDGTLPQTNAGAHPQIPNSGWRVDYDANMPRSSANLREKINCNIGQYQTWTETAGARETMPANCVSWYVAFAFCVWDGGRLPTEAEWEVAAANGEDGLRYPWGNSTPAADKHAVFDCLGDGVIGCTPNDILPIGSRINGANKWGHLDLAGSVWEWTLDYYDATYYQAIGTCAACACNNCSNLSELTPRVIRGGGFTSTGNMLRATARASKSPISADAYTGFRCVRTR